MSKIAIVGSRSKALCFMAAGFSVYEAENDSDAAAQLKKAADDGCAVIFITSEYGDAVAEAAVRYAGMPVPAVTVLPEEGNGGVKMLSEAVARAVGSDIIFHGETD